MEDYGKYDTPLIDPHKPYAWEECVVNLVMLDMLKNNKIFDSLDWTEGFMSHSYPNI